MDISSGGIYIRGKKKNSNPSASNPGKSWYYYYYYYYYSVQLLARINATIVVRQHQYTKSWSDYDPKYLYDGRDKGLLRGHI